MALTDDERVSIKHHLGYPSANALQTFLLSVPAAVEPLFMLEGSMNAIAPGAESRVRRTLVRLDKIDEQIEENADTLVASEADEVKLRDNEFELLMKRYGYWQGELCNLLGVPCPNPFDSRKSGFGMAGGNLNIGVSHG